MTVVGKIMIVLILVMSVLFMGFTVANYATHQNWKEQVEGPNGLKNQRDQLRQDKLALQNQIETTKNKLALETAARTEAISVLETRANRLRDELVTLGEELAEKQAEHRAALTALTTYQQNMTGLKDEVDILRAANQKSQQERDDAFMAAKKLMDDLHQGEGDMRRLSERYQQLIDKLEKVGLVLARNDLDENSPIDHIAPDVNGEVTHVRNAGLIEISIGSDEGLRAGHILKVFRIGVTGAFLANVEVITTTPDRAVARVIPDTRNGTIRKGDYVATKIL